MGSYEEEPVSEEGSNDNVKPSQDVGDDVKLSQDVDEDDGKPQRNATDIESAGKLFVGGLARETTSAEFEKHFEKYGEIIDSVIMKYKETGVPRGFGFVTFADSSVIDKVIQDTHILNGREVEIERTIPRGSKNSKERKTKKLFVGGIPLSVDDDEFKELFKQFGKVKEHQIMREHTSEKSRGFGFITYESSKMVDLLLAKGNRIELGGTQVEIKKAEPKKPNSAPLPSRWSSDSRSSFSGNSGDSYGGGYGGSGGPYKSTGGYGNGSSGGYGGGRSGGYGGEFGGYGGGYGSGVGPYRGEPPSGYSGRYGGGGGSGYNIGGYGSGGPYGELGGAYGGPSSSYGGGYRTGGSGLLGAYGGAGGSGLLGADGSGLLGAYGGAGGSGLLGAYGGAGSEGCNRGGGRYPMGGGRSGGGGGYDGGRRGGGGGGRGGPSYGSSRYHPYGR